MAVPEFDFNQLQDKAEEAVRNGSLPMEWFEVGFLMYAKICELSRERNMIQTLANAETKDPRWYLNQINDLMRSALAERTA